MSHIKEVQPLSYEKRKRTFGLLLAIFIVSLPFLYLYATGYRFDIGKQANLVGTGGIYVAVERTGAEIYIDDELVRETRVFRRAFYAQNLDARTHRVHVQKEGHHTWVKELPVAPHRVTEAQAFNLPIHPQVRVIAQWQSATGSAIVQTELLTSSTTNSVIATTTTATTSFVANPEFISLRTHFGTTSDDTLEDETIVKRLQEAFEATTTETENVTVPTTTKESNGVRLFMSGDELHALWTGAFEQMPYYYCAEPFPRYSTTTVLGEVDSQAALVTGADVEEGDSEAEGEDVSELMHPVQTVPKDTPCTPEITMDTRWQTVRDFDFFPGSTDFVVMELDDGIYVAEIDPRSWQNVQPLIMGDMLNMYVESGNIYVYDGALIYQVMFEL